ncbi:hypothetical protein [Adlercreutzia agrestimuris]|uniref:hypothetical protein n=1 Tax=Adlercreutzia agrestimuris TaxID=2941324 RepID=UPI00203E75CA|nr:hypothetical protein [Adlercreutzia agrestimuris]
MATYIGQASCDENVRYVEGQAGNQTGTELNTRAAYLYNWHSLIRFRDPAKALKCGQAMAAAVSNMKNGYDQGERNTILPLARAAGWGLSKITTACECDCSSLAGICGIAARIPESYIYKDGNLCYTGNQVACFEASGIVDVYSTSDYANSTVKWQVGDILVSNSHTVVVVSGNAPSGSGTATAVSGDIDELAQVVIAGRYGNGDARRAALGDKFNAVQKRVNQLLSGTVSAAGTSTGVARIIAGEYKVVASSLNVRDKPSLSGSKVASYSYGEHIYSIAADTVTADGYV